MAEGPVLRRLARSASEDDLLQFVRDAAGWGRWLIYHTHDSRRSEGGFPDVVAVHPDLRRLVFAELKSARGGWRPGQQEWLQALQLVSWVNPGAGQALVPEVYLWRPADCDEIVRVFLGHRRWRYRPTAEPEAVASGATPDRPGRS